MNDKHRKHFQQYVKNHKNITSKYGKQGKEILKIFAGDVKKAQKCLEDYYPESKSDAEDFSKNTINHGYKALIETHGELGEELLRKLNFDIRKTWTYLEKYQIGFHSHTTRNPKDILDHELFWDYFDAHLGVMVCIGDKYYYFIDIDQ